MNVALLRKVIKAIKREPRRVDMSTWLDNRDRIAPCGTVACIAGHAVVLSKQKRGQGWLKAACAAEEQVRDIEEEAKRVLDLDYEQGMRLFHSDYWPTEFTINGEPSTARERKQEAAVAVKRIEHFIKTKGED